MIGCCSNPFYGNGCLWDRCYLCSRNVVFIIYCLYIMWWLDVFCWFDFVVLYIIMYSKSDEFDSSCFVVSFFDLNGQLVNSRFPHMFFYFFWAFNSWTVPVVELLSKYTHGMAGGLKATTIWNIYPHLLPLILGIG